MTEGELSANQRAAKMTHPFRLKILLVYYFDSKFSAGGSLEGQFDFTTYSSETHTTYSAVTAVFQDAGSDITVM